MMTSTGAGSNCPAIEGKLWAWGEGNTFLGLGDTTSRSSPSQVGALTDWTNNLSTGETTHVIKTDGTLWGWGNSDYGEMGVGNTTKYSSPVQIGSDTDWATIQGSMFCAAIKTNGTLYTWGNNFYGQLGQGDTTHRCVPTQVGSLTDWASVMIPQEDGYYMVMMKTDGTLWSMGCNDAGQLGDGTDTVRSSPVQIGSATDWLAYIITEKTTSGRGYAISEA